MAIEGSLKDMSLVDIIQLICRNREASRVIVEQGQESGAIYLAEGGIVHALQGDEEGEEALYRLLQWEEGRFRIEKDVSSPEQSIHRPWTAILMQVLQRLDEERDAREHEGGDTETEDTTFLQELAERVPGLVAGYITDTLGMTFTGWVAAQKSAFDAEAAPEGLFRLIGSVEEALEAIEAGALEETITVTANYRFITRCYDEGTRCLQIVLATDGNLGAARMYLTAYQLSQDAREAAVPTAEGGMGMLE
ncbi:MAG: DUF4388 domain-containing protein [Anaerolineales bacterium]